VKDDKYKQVNRGIPKGYRWICNPKLSCNVPQNDIFLTGIIGYNRLRLYLKIYAPKNEMLGTPLQVSTWCYSLVISLHWRLRLHLCMWMRTKPTVGLLWLCCLPADSDWFYRRLYIICCHLTLTHSHTHRIVTLEVS